MRNDRRESRLFFCRNPGELANEVESPFQIWYNSVMKKEQMTKEQENALWQKCIAFHGHVCGGILIGFKASLYAMELLDIRFSPDEELVCITENDACGVDAIQVMLGCTMGKGNLLLHLKGKQAYSFYNRTNGKSVRLVLRETVRKEGVSKLEYMKDMDPAALFDVKDVKEELPPLARIFKSYPCDVCGETTAEPMLRQQGSQRVCLDCTSARESAEQSSQHSRTSKASEQEPIDTILFDFDGTVMDTTDVVIGSWQHTFRTLEGKERPLEEIFETLGEPLAYTMPKVLPDVDPEEAIEVYRSYHRDNFGSRISVFEGMTELLAELKRRGFKTGLVTSRLGHTTWEGLRKYQLDAYFDVVVSCDDTDKHKPDPTPVFMTLERLGSRPQNSLMLGDTMFDILCAKNAGVRSVLVGWAVAVSQEQIRGEDGPDYVIDKAEDLLTLIEQLSTEVKDASCCESTTVGND